MHHNPAASYDFGVRITLACLMPFDTEWQALASTMYVDEATRTFAEERTEYVFEQA